MMSIIFMIKIMILLIFLKLFYKYIYFMILILNLIMIFLMKFIMMDFIWIGIYMMYGLDKYSFGMIILCLWILMMMIFLSMKIYKFNFYMLIIMLLLFFLMFCFLSMNYFMFYMFFESSMIPILFLIIGWGFQPERIMASFYMFLYTMFSSMPLLSILFFLNEYFLSLNYLILLNNNMNCLNLNFLLYFFMIFAFLVKLPIFMFHAWLPKAHVEAPIIGSMVLAGIMLKLGSYGLIRSLIMMMNLSMKYNLFIFIISLWGGLILSLLCFIQVDLKILVAYSSIVHMSLLLMSMFTLKFMGFLGSYLMMISHGICSSCLFNLVNFNYLRLNSRMFIMNKGMLMVFPNLMMWWFLICVSNISSPFSLNLFGELMIFFSLLSFSYLILLILCILMFFSSLYSIYLFSSIFHGKMFMYMYNMYMNFMKEFILIIIHWVPLNLIFLNLNLF